MYVIYDFAHWIQAVSSFFQIFKDGASYQGCIKCMACDIIKFHYKDALKPYINFGHNSDQHNQVIANNVKSLINKLMFIQGPPDVSSLFINEPH